jgi:thymidylate synthase (FAD)
MTNRFEHQTVRLIGVTSPNSDILIEGYDPNFMAPMTPQDLVSYCARVSNPSNQTNFDTAGKLLGYMIKNKHWSPFEMVSLTMEICTTRDIGRQILRHRSFSFQEFSQRYAAAQEMVHRETRLQDTKNRQNSIENTNDQLDFDWHVKQHEIMLKADEYYQWALKNGVAKEQARCILPEGMTMSRMYMAGTLRSWIHYVDLRDDPGVTQAEHVDIAQKAKVILLNEFPFLKDYWNES